MILFKDIDKVIRHEILSMIKTHGWKLVLKEYPYMIRVRKGFEYSLVTMNIYWNGKGQVKKISTHLDHPKKGKRQMYRTLEKLSELEQYLINPRKHTNKGYSKK